MVASTLGAAAAGDGALHGTDDDDEQPADLLKPFEWEGSPLEERSCWLETCGDTARDALKKLAYPRQSHLGEPE